MVDEFLIDNMIIYIEKNKKLKMLIPIQLLMSSKT